MIYIEGKSKLVFDKEDRVLIEFTDKGVFSRDGEGLGFSGRGKMNNEISVAFFRLLENEGMATHFLEDLNDRQILARKLDIIPFEVVCRNMVMGELVKKLPQKKGTRLLQPIVEFHLKNDATGNSLINDDHAEALGISRVICDELREKTREINWILFGFFEQSGIILGDLKLEFGFDCDGRILLADEITPDSCRFFMEGESCARDALEFSLGDAEDRHRRIHKIVCG